MFDKLKYNNLIISGGKDIQKAKVQVLRKIIQKLRKLKNAVERKPDDESCKIKLRKCLSVVESAKKIKKFEALTNILLLEKCPNKIVTNSQSTPEEVAIAMLASNPTMKTLLAKIKQELSLSDADLPTWRKALIQLSKRKIKTQQKKKRKQVLEAASPGEKKLKSKIKPKSSSLPKKKAKNISKTSSVNQNETEENEDILANGAAEDESAPSKTKIKTQTQLQSSDAPVDILEADKKMKRKKTQKPDFISPVAENNLSFEVESKKNNQPKTKNLFADDKNNALENSYLNSNFQKKSSSFAKENFFSQMKSSDFQNKRSISQTEIKITKVVDPFFMTSTGENYVAIAPVIEANNEVDESNRTIKEPKYIDDKKFKPDSQKIQPAWEPKQKQRSLIGSQGKRKVFDEAVDQKAKDKNLINDLHPSWAAKQKLKPSIAAFQGKKIKFEDE